MKQMYSLYFSIMLIPFFDTTLVLPFPPVNYTGGGENLYFIRCTNHNICISTEIS